MNKPIAKKVHGKRFHRPQFVLLITPEHIAFLLQFFFAIFHISHGIRYRWLQVIQILFNFKNHFTLSQIHFLDEKNYFATFTFGFY